MKNLLFLVVCCASVSAQGIKTQTLGREDGALPLPRTTIHKGKDGREFVLKAEIRKVDGVEYDIAPYRAWRMGMLPNGGVPPLKGWIYVSGRPVEPLGWGSVYNGGGVDSFSADGRRWVKSVPTIFVVKGGWKPPGDGDFAMQVGTTKYLGRTIPVFDTGLGTSKAPEPAPTPRPGSTNPPPFKFPRKVPPPK